MPKSLSISITFLGQKSLYIQILIYIRMQIYCNTEKVSNILFEVTEKFITAVDSVAKAN